MKRSILFLLCLTVLLSALLAGCGGQKSSDDILPAGTDLEALYAEGME